MRTIWALIRRDVTLGMRASGGAALSAAFFVLIVILVPFGLGPQLSALQQVDVFQYPIFLKFQTLDPAHSQSNFFCKGHFFGRLVILKIGLI